MKVVNAGELRSNCPKPPCNPRDAANHPDCVTCQSSDGPVPYHDGSKNCQSGSISSGGANSHCTCDTCF